MYNMKTITVSILTAVVVVTCAKGDSTLTERQGKYLNFNSASDLGKLNFDRILSQWNKSEMVRPVHTTEEPEEKDVNGTRTDLLGILRERSVGFKKCIFGQKKKILENPGERKNVIFKCFKLEVIKGLRGIMTETESVSLLNGYIVLESIDKKPSKGHKKKVVKDKDRKSHSEYYKNVVDGWFEDKESSREFKSGYTEAIFSAYGRYLLNEIAEKLGEEKDEVRSLKDSFMDKDLLSVIEEMSRKFVLRLNLFRGMSAIMKRSQSTGVTFDLELDDLTGFGDDDDDDDKEKKADKKKIVGKGPKDDSSEEYDEEDDSDEEDDDEEEDDDDDDDDNRDAIADDEEEEPGSGKGKGKGKGQEKKKMKKKMKMMKKLVPFLLIPMMIQAAMLPLAFKFLLAFAIKALIAGKIALLLVAINLIKNTNFKSDEDEYIERVGQEHYGYGKGEEYGAWVNKRSFGNDQWTTENHPYRAYTPADGSK